MERLREEVVRRDAGAESMLGPVKEDGAPAAVSAKVVAVIGVSVAVAAVAVAVPAAIMAVAVVAPVVAVALVQIHCTLPSIPLHAPPRM
jgi:phosphoribosylanthranilate isomerase